MRINLLGLLIRILVKYVLDGQRYNYKKIAFYTIRQP